MISAMLAHVAPNRRNRAPDLTLVSTVRSVPSVTHCFWKCRCHTVGTRTGDIGGGTSSCAVLCSGVAATVAVVGATGSPSSCAAVEHVGLVPRSLLTNSSSSSSMLIVPTARPLIVDGA